MGFIHKLSTLGPSSSGYLNFLWKADDRPIYMMDNHLAALWCWLTELDENDEYSMVHIDYHWDDAPSEAPQLLRALPSKPSLAEFLAIKSPGGLRMSSGDWFPLVRWDNYLSLLPTLRPGAQSLFQATHQIETGNAPPRFRDISSSQSVENLLRLPDALNYEKCRHLINLDLDYFFIGDGADNLRPFTHDFIKTVVARLDKAAPEALWTIAWSPECCGGWEAAAEVARIVCTELDLGFPFTDRIRSANRVVTVGGAASQARAHGRAKAEADARRARGMGEASRAVA